VTLADFEQMKASVLFGEDDVTYLRMSHDVVKDEVEAILDVWYGFVGSQPHLLASFTGKADGKPLGDYLGAVRKRFGQWILDTAHAEYDQKWLDYQHEIGLRHHRAKKNKTDGAALDRPRPVPQPVRADLPGDLHAPAVPREEGALGRGRREDVRGVGQVVPAAGHAVEPPLREGRRLLMTTTPALAPSWRTTEWLNTPEPLTLEQLRGRVVLLHAFQMLCPGCVSRGIPQAQRVAELFAGAPLVVVGLHTVFEHHDGMKVESLRAFLHEYRVRFPRRGRRA
jgi:hypothetical protein